MARSSSGHKAIESRRTAVFALLLLFLPAVARSYNLYQVRTGTTDTIPMAWSSGQINLVVSGDEVFLAEVRAAMKTWNDVPTAADQFGRADLLLTPLTAEDFGRTWGVTDGSVEVVLDRDGSILRAHPSPTDAHGLCRVSTDPHQGWKIVDGYVVISASAPDRLGTLVHELGHLLGLAHTAVGMYNTSSFPAAALDVIDIASVPSMYAYSDRVPIGAKRTLEADDMAALTHLYPDTSSRSSYVAVYGYVGACGTTPTKYLMGAHVRAIDTSNSVSQIGAFTAHGAPSTFIMQVPRDRTYKFVVEPIAGSTLWDRVALGLGYLGAVDQYFRAERADMVKTQGTLVAPGEPVCTEKTPNEETLTIKASDVTEATFWVAPADQAWVIDTTGSMQNEIGLVRNVLTLLLVDLLSRPTFPTIALVTFDDQVSVPVVTNDPGVLQSAVDYLFASGGGDCPESANAALLVASRLVKKKGLIWLVTDADSRPDGPSKETVKAAINDASQRQITMLTGTCPKESAAALECNPTVPDVPTAVDGLATSEEVGRPPTLGYEAADRTFSSLATETGGFFAAFPAVKDCPATSTSPTCITERRRFVNTGVNTASSAVGPTIGLVSPGDGPRGVSMTVELHGLNTNFVSASTVSFAASGVAVNSVTVVSPTKIVARVAVSATATLGFGDVTVTTPLGAGTTEVAVGRGAFNIVEAPVTPTIVGATPSQAARGTRLNVEISGVNTHFGPASSADFGAGITVNDLRPITPTSAVANITIADGAEIGFRSITLTTGSEVARSVSSGTSSLRTGPFFVTAPPPIVPRVTQVAPGEVQRGQAVELDITGEHTAFVNGTTSVSFSGAGLTPAAAVVLTPTTLRVSVTIAADAELGFHDVFVTTGSERAVLLSGLHVVAPGIPTTYRCYLAEGATGGFFDMRLAIANPNPSATTVGLEFQRADGIVVPHALTLAPMSRASIDPETIAGLQEAEFSTMIDATQRVVVDRTMWWDARGYGSHAESAMDGASTTWYLAEGATHSGFDLFYLVQNPNPVAARIQVRYLLPSPKAPIVKQYTVEPKSRFNIWVNYEDPALGWTDVSGVITSVNGQPVIVERAMYLSSFDLLFDAGHESAGITTPATSWFLAEGATGDYFDEFVLIANPDDRTARVQARFLLPDGAVITKGYEVPGNSRFNIWVDVEDPRLADTAVSMTLTSTNDVPLIVERAMWWPFGFVYWQEAHNAAGATSSGTKWVLAEGEVGGPRQSETYILIANTSDQPGEAVITLLFESGAPVSRTVPLEASSRTNVVPALLFADQFSGGDGHRRFSTIVESIGATPAQIVVERAMYTGALGVWWMAGTDALATKLR